MATISIIDGYIDEPTCLGVPPYISPYPRYIAGAIKDFSKEINIKYFTIDQIRSNPSLISIFEKSTIIIVITGMVVPGKYLSGYPLHPKEIIKIFDKIHNPIKLLCGPAATFGFGVSGGKKPGYYHDILTIFDALIKGDPEIVISELLKNNLQLDQINMFQKRKNAEQIRNYAIKGAEIVSQHPFFPNRLIVEIETYRGCPRSLTGGCSFCIEPTKGLPDFRSIKSIHDEIHELYSNGIRHFRIGNQPCLFSYQSEYIGKNECPKPNPNAIEQLFSGIRKIAPDLKTLHIDNVNPGVVANYPDESQKIIQTIVKYHTSGDVAAFGVESVDDAVISQNNLKADKNMILDAIRLFNKYGSSIGSNGLSELLPGLNFVFGLKGETKKTFKENYSFLQNIVKENLLIRRINLRQVIPLIGTEMELIGEKIIRKHKKDFQSFKYKVKTTIEQPLLKKLIPRCAILTDIYPELWKGNITFGRQIGSYPILVGIPGKYPLNKPLTIKIIDHGYRSVTGIPYPLNINTCPQKTIESLNGIGKKRAIRIIKNRPYDTIKDLENILDDKEILSPIIPLISLDENGD
ncbi:MAG: radical SAM protein [Thermoplasmata archaeon]|nr:MAG: radical SAM protein [Thermoplasmata archaeon]